MSTEAVDKTVDKALAAVPEWRQRWSPGLLMKY